MQYSVLSIARIIYWNTEQMTTLKPSAEVLIPSTEISEAMISSIIKRLESGNSVHRQLPFGGHLHLDRQMPFLLIYRQNAKTLYLTTEKLLRGESSYLVADGKRKHSKSIELLVSAIAESLAKSFGAFLLIEIWPEESDEFKNIVPEFRPAFRILSRKKDVLSPYALTLQKALSLIKVQRTNAQVSLSGSSHPWAPGLPRLISSAFSKKINCHYLGIGIRPVYQPQDSEETFPLLLRTLHRGMGRAIRRSVFNFTRDLTVQKPPHFHALGPRSLVKLVWEVDKELAEISNDFDFLLSVTPVNADKAWHTYKRKHFAVNPQFIYRPLPIDPAELKRKLYRIPIEKIEDPALEALFRAQRTEIERKLTMLSDRGNRNFLYGSLQLYGIVETSLLNAAQYILDNVSAGGKKNTSVKKVRATEFAAIAKKEIQFYRDKNPQLSSRVEMRDDVVGIMVSQGNLLLNNHLKVAENRVDALLAHEIGTHVLTYFNGQAQPFQQLYTGLPDYEELQEGIAVLAEYLTGGLTEPRLRMLAARVVAADMIIDGAEFTEVFRVLDDQYGFTQKTAFNVTLRIFRGGGFLKDMVYLRGLMGVLEYLGNGGPFESLLLGKFGASHLHIIRELQWRKVITPPALIPRYLELPEVQKKLESVRQGLSLMDLIKRI